jgi:hypothetical protein
MSEQIVFLVVGSKQWKIRAPNSHTLHIHFTRTISSLQQNIVLNKTLNLSSSRKKYSDNEKQTITNGRHTNMYHHTTHASLDITLDQNTRTRNSDITFQSHTKMS